MMKLPGLLFALAALWSVVSAAADPTATVHHALRVTLDPAAHRLDVEDRITLAAPAESVTLLLHAGLDPEAVGGSAALSDVAEVDGGPVPLQRFTVTLTPAADSFTLRYGGTIHHSPKGASTPGIIAPEGVVLSGASYWVPQPVDFRPMVTFSLTVENLAGWRSVSQGRRQQQGNRETWIIDKPQQEIYLIAAEFTEYDDSGSQGIEGMVFLRQPDPELARRYLDATRRYLAMYGELIGPYPYSKFALVENYWQTGYGMPSFTLLGSRVIRLPFILYTSYPHEILHNWWGNSVYVDYASGNWSEGLTSYLADYWLQEQRGPQHAADYRRQTLQKYADYVRDQNDFPLTAFRARHGAASQAVGYGKTMMLFHMLRRQLGDQRFFTALRQFYRQYRFKVAGFADIEAVFDAVAGEPLSDLFRQWTERSGAPALALSEVDTEAGGGGFILTALIEQTQPGEPYRLRVPVAVELDNGASVAHTVIMDAARQPLRLELPARPTRLAVDPEFDLFRRLDRGEIPPALSQAFGAERALAVLPSAAPAALQTAYRELAQTWGLDTIMDSELSTAISGRTLWLFGWQNLFLSSLQLALHRYPINLTGDTVTLERQRLTPQTHAVTVVARRPANPEHAIVWLAADNPAALAGLARKLPHYGKYSYLAFTGDAPDNVLKGQWPVIQSPLTATLKP